MGRDRDRCDGRVTLAMREVSEELAKTKVPKALVAVEELLDVVEVVTWVGVTWLRSTMFVCTLDAVLTRDRELRKEELCGARAADETVPEEPTARHAEANVACLEETLHGISLAAGGTRLEVVPRLRLPAVLARVAAALVGAVGGIEEHDVYGAGTEGGEEEVMWHDPLIIRGIAAAQGEAPRSLIILLLGLLWPGEKEATRAAVL